MYVRFCTFECVTLSHPFCLSAVCTCGVVYTCVPYSTASSSPLAAPPPPLKSMSVLEALKRPEYKVENIRKDAAKESTDTIDLTSDNEEEDEQLEEKETEEVS